MNVLLEKNSEVIIGVTPLTKRSDVTEDCRLFYELGEFIHGGWWHSGKFKEIKNPVEYVNKDKKINDPRYIEHHNFVVLKKC